MTTWALVPLKAFARSKQRLDGHLDSEQRAALVQGMAASVIAALLAQARIAGVAVVSADASVRHWAAARGALAIDEPGSGLNDALSTGARVLHELGATRLLVVPADLPHIEAADLAMLMTDPAPTLVTVVRAMRDGGTNALLLPLPLPFALCFGHDSAARHHAAAMQVGQPARLIGLRSFDHDIDLPEDLRRLDQADALRLPDPVVVPA